MLCSRFSYKVIQPFILGDDWDELEKKAAKCVYFSYLLDYSPLMRETADKKRVEGGGGASDSDDDKPKKKKAPVKTNNKPKARR